MHHVVVGKAVHWLLGEVGKEIFAVLKRRLMERAGFAPETGVSQRFLEEYTQQLQSRVSEHIISRLDEDRIATLEGAVAQVRMAAKTSLRTEYLAAAGSKFFDRAPA